MYLKFYKINCHNISAVISNSLYAASPLKFNDPFEAACNIEEATQMAIANIPYSPENALRYRTRRFVMCLVHTNDVDIEIQNTLMWSHYADSHKGFCVVYKDNIAQFLQRETNYVAHQKVIYAPNIPTITNYNDGYELTPIFTKSNAWEYEHEERYVFKKEGLYKLGKPGETIEAIYLGVNINILSPCYKELVDFAMQNNIPCYQAMLSTLEYQLNFEKIKIS